MLSNLFHNLAMTLFMSSLLRLICKQKLYDLNITQIELTNLKDRARLNP